MPWKISDVESKIKGLTPVEKKRWVEIANNTLRKCISEGGTDETCSPIAIKTANSAAKNFNLAMFLDGPLVNIVGMEIFRVGTWNGRKFEEKDIMRVVNNFKSLKGLLVPKLKITHREKQETLAGLASFGDIVNIEAKNTRGCLRVFADINFVPKRVAEWIRDRRFAERSIELRYVFRVNNKEYKDVITAVSLLGHEIPAVAGMEPIKLSKEDNFLDTKESVGISYTIDSNEETFTFEDSFIEYENKQKGGDNMDINEILGKLESLQSTIDSIVQKQKDAETKFNLGQDAGEKKKVQDELDKYKKDLEGLEVMKTDYEKMKTSLEDSNTLNLKLKLEGKTTKVESFLKDLKNSGKLLPAFEKEAKSLLLKLSEEEKLGTFSKINEEGKAVDAELSQFETFQNLLLKLPKIVNFKEDSFAKGKGSETMQEEIEVGGETFQLNDVELDAAAQEYMKEHKDADYETAVIAASTQFKATGKAQGLSEGE